MRLNLLSTPKARPRRRAHRAPSAVEFCGGPLRGLARQYARNLLVGTDVGQWRADDGRPAVEARPLVREVAATHAVSTSDGAADFRATLERFLQAAAGGLPRVLVKGSPLEGNIRAVARAAGLTSADAAVLQFFATILLARGLEPFTDMFGPLGTGPALDLVAVATGLPRPVVAEVLAPEGQLASAGLITLEAAPVTLECKFALDVRLRDLLATPGLKPRQLEQIFMPRAPRPTLAAADFAHLGATFEHAGRLLASALDRRERGINLLLHGPTGCGKTELAGVLARQVRAALRTAGESGPAGFTPSPPERLASLLLGQRMLARSRSLLLFDELEDLFDAGGGRGRGHATTRMSKVWFNRLLEENRVPTIWITNDASGLDPAFLRRFSMSIELEPLDAPRRGAVLRRAGAHRAGLSSDEVQRIAARFPVSAAELTGAVRVARLVRGGKVEAPVVEGLLGASVKLLTGAPAPAEPVRAASYRVDLVNATLDLDALATRLTAVQQQGVGVTLCLHGPPGTGKSEYVRHLAERLGRPLVTRRVSEVESKWVGEAEKNLAAAFAQAERERAILLFDEADSFLRDRTRATQRWETTLTNEFLQLLEGTRGVVACTTNLYGDLDKAVLRRFALRIGFDYLEPEQAAAMFEATFRPLLPGAGPSLAAEAARRLERCGPLAPGDFAVVERRALLLGASATVEWLAAELALEAAERGPARRPTLGFDVGGRGEAAAGGAA